MEMEFLMDGSHFRVWFYQIIGLIDFGGRGGVRNFSAIKKRGIFCWFFINFNLKFYWKYKEKKMEVEEIESFIFSMFNSFIFYI